MTGHTLSANDSLTHMFLSTAGKRLTELGEVLATLRRAADVDEVIERLARDLHTYKGESRLLGLGEIEQITHAAETMLLARQRAGRIDETAEHLLTESIELILVCVQARLEGRAWPEVEGLVERLREGAEIDPP